MISKTNKNKVSSIAVAALLIASTFVFVTPVQPAHAQTAVSPPAGMISWWPGDGNANDIVGGNNGILQNFATFAPGMVGQAFSFNGMNQFVSVANNPSLNPPSITVDAWFRASAITGQTIPPIVKKAGEGLAQNDGYALEINNNIDGTVRFWVFVSGIGWTNAASSGPVLANTWYHVAGTYDGNAIKLYLNGALQGTTLAAGGMVPSSNPLFIGSDPANPTSRFFNGLIDEVEIYNHALTLTEIASIFNAGTAGKIKPPTQAAFTQWDLPFFAGFPLGALIVDKVGAAGTVSPAGTVWTVGLGVCHLVQFTPGSPLTGTATWKSWSLEPVGSVGGLKITPNDVVFVQTTNDMQRIDPSTNQHTRWFIGGGMSDLALDANNNVYTIVSPLAFGGTGQLQKLTPVGLSGASVTRWSLALPLPFFSFGDLVGVAVNQATGKVYFSNLGINAIGELDPLTNQVRSWPLSAVGASLPRQLSIDTAGDVWVITISNHIVRLNVSTNQLTAFTPPQQITGNNLGGIVAGSVIGFTEHFTNKIGTLTPNGAPGTVIPQVTAVTQTTFSIPGATFTEPPSTGTTTPVTSTTPVTTTGNFVQAPLPSGSFLPRGIDRDIVSASVPFFFSAGGFFPVNQIGRVEMPAGDTTPPTVTVQTVSPTGPVSSDITINPDTTTTWINRAVLTAATGSPTAQVDLKITATDPSNVVSITCTQTSFGTNPTNTTPTTTTTPFTSTSPNTSGFGTSTATVRIPSLGDGRGNVSCTATDGASNTGAAAGSTNTATVKIDRVAPATTPTIPTPSGTNGWFKATVPATVPVNVGLSSTDPGTSGVNSISCTVTNTALTPSTTTTTFSGVTLTGAGTNTASATLTISNEGVNNFSCAATDVAGNIETTATGIVKIDTVAPVATSIVASAVGATPSLVTIGGVPTIADKHVGAGTVKFAVTYTEATSGIATSINPTLSFSPAAGVTTPPSLTPPSIIPATLSSPTPSWGGSPALVHTTVYNVADSEFDVNSVSSTATGATDVAGNVQTAFTQANVVGVDTLDPTVVLPPNITVVGGVAGIIIRSNVFVDGTPTAANQNGVLGAIVTYSASAVDPGSSTPTPPPVVSNPPSGTTFGMNDDDPATPNPPRYTVTFTATDEVGNTNSITGTFEVRYSSNGCATLVGFRGTVTASCGEIPLVATSPELAPVQVKKTSDNEIIVRTATLGAKFDFTPTTTTTGNLLVRYFKSVNPTVCPTGVTTNCDQNPIAETWQLFTSAGTLVSSSDVNLIPPIQVTGDCSAVTGNDGSGTTAIPAGDFRCNSAFVKLTLSTPFSSTPFLITYKFPGDGKQEHEVTFGPFPATTSGQFRVKQLEQGIRADRILAGSTQFSLDEPFDNLPTDKAVFGRVEPHPAVVGKPITCVGLTNDVEDKAFGCAIFPGTTLPATGPFAIGQAAFSQTCNTGVVNCFKSKVTFAGASAPNTPGIWTAALFFTDTTPSSDLNNDGRLDDSDFQRVFFLVKPSGSDVSVVEPRDNLPRDNDEFGRVDFHPVVEKTSINCVGLTHDADQERFRCAIFPGTTPPTTFFASDQSSTSVPCNPPRVNCFKFKVTFADASAPNTPGIWTARLFFDDISPTIDKNNDGRPDDSEFTDIQFIVVPSTELRAVDYLQRDTLALGVLLDPTFSQIPKFGTEDVSLTVKVSPIAGSDQFSVTAEYLYGATTPFTVDATNRIFIDPETLTSPLPTEDSFVVKSKSGAFSRPTTTNALEVGIKQDSRPAGTTQPFCTTGDGATTGGTCIQRGLIEWNTASIKNAIVPGSLIDAVRFKYSTANNEISGTLAAGTLSITPLTVQPSVTTNDDVGNGNLWADAFKTTTAYLSGLVRAELTTPIEENLGASAITDLVSGLTKGWFGIGLTSDNNDLATVSDLNNFKRVRAQEDASAGIQKPLLLVDFTRPNAYYKFEDTIATTGTTPAIDSSGLGNAGTIVGATSVPSGRVGFGNAFHFDGSTSKVKIPDNMIKNNVVITISAWFKTTVFGVIIGYQNTDLSTPAPAAVPVIYISTDGKLRGQLWQGTVNPISTTGTVFNGQWHHVALVASTDTQTLYLDGAPVGTLTGTINNLDMSFNQIGAGRAEFFPGGPSGAVSNFNGDIDDFRIYTRALSATEIANINANGVAGNP